MCAGLTDKWVKCACVTVKWVKCVTALVYLSSEWRMCRSNWQECEVCALCRSASNWQVSEVYVHCAGRQESNFWVCPDSYLLIKTHLMKIRELWLYKVRHTLSQHLTEYPHKNRACHGWSKCNGTVHYEYIWLLGHFTAHIAHICIVQCTM